VNEFTERSWKLKDVQDFIKQNIVFITNGAVTQYITKNIKDDQLYFMTVSPRDLRHSLPMVTIGKKVVPMFSIMERIHKQISYLWIVFRPWLIKPIDTTRHVSFNMFTGMAHTYDPAFEVDTSKFNLVTQHLLEVCVMET